jgi:hypothetical protein
MLPLLRVLPVGSFLLTALIFMLAVTPPRHSVLPYGVAPARGPLIDAAAHPEWRQFYVQAAFKRADELDHLRDLPNTPTRMPVIAVPEPPQSVSPPVAGNEAVAALAPAAPAIDKSGTPALGQEQIAPALPLVIENTSSAAPDQESLTPEPLSADAAPQRLPREPEAADSEDITGALDNRAVAATMPMEIGETSSTELPVVLPRERPVKVPPVRPKASSRAKTQRAIVRQSKPKQAARAAKRRAAPAVKKARATVVGASSER